MRVRWPGTKPGDQTRRNQLGTIQGWRGEDRAAAACSGTALAPGAETSGRERDTSRGKLADIDRGAVPTLPDIRTATMEET